MKLSLYWKSVVTGALGNRSLCSRHGLTPSARAGSGRTIHTAGCDVHHCSTAQLLGSLSSPLLTALVTLENVERDNRSGILKGLSLLLCCYWEAD